LLHQDQPLRSRDLFRKELLQLHRCLVDAEEHQVRIDRRLAAPHRKKISPIVFRFLQRIEVQQVQHCYHERGHGDNDRD
jgi:hypothetical protein